MDSRQLADILYEFARFASGTGSLSATQKSLRDCGLTFPDAEKITDGASFIRYELRHKPEQDKGGGLSDKMVVIEPSRKVRAMVMYAAESVGKSDAWVYQLLLDWMLADKSATQVLAIVKLLVLGKEDTSVS